MISLKTLAMAAVASITMALGAHAAIVSTLTKEAEITCSASCAFWDLDLDPDGFNELRGSWLTAEYGGINNSNSGANRLTFVNNVLGTTFSERSGTSDNEATPTGVGAIGGFSDGDNGAGWTGSSQYYLAWGGSSPRYVLIQSFAADNIFTWNATGRGSGLSGVDGFGTITPIPLPAAGLMLLAGLGGLAALRRRPV